MLAPGGRADVFIDVAMPAGTSTPILLHDGKEARPVGKIVVSSEPPIRPAPLPLAPPLPSNGLPERLELKNATRVDLALGGPQGDWVTPAKFNATAPPAFRVKADRTVVLALTNRAAIADRLPPPRPSLPPARPARRRLEAVLAGYAGDRARTDPAYRLPRRISGRYLIESVATDWAAPRLVRWYAVE